MVCAIGWWDGVLWLSPVLHGGVQIGEYIGGASEVGGYYLAEVDGVVACLQFACHPALEVGEGLFEERGARLPGRVGRPAYGAVLVLEGFGEPAGEVLLFGVQEVEREDAGVLYEVVGVLVLAHRDDELLGIEGHLRDPAGSEAVGFAIAAGDPCDVEAVGDGLEYLAADLFFHASLLRRSLARALRALVSTSPWASPCGRLVSTPAFSRLSAFQLTDFELPSS